MSHVILWNGGINFVPMLSRSIGPYKIAHWLRKNGYTAQVIEHVPYHSEEQLYSATKKFITKDTSVIGVSTTFIGNNGYKHSDGIFRRIPENVLNVLLRLKKEHPNLKVVMGGYMSDRLPSWNVFDFTIMNYLSPTEDIFLEFMNHITKGYPEPIGEMRETKIGSRNEYRMMYDGARNPRYNIEYDDFRFIKEDVILPGEPLPLDISRGCIFACKFCQYPHLGKKKLDYIRSMDLIKEEIIYNQESFGTTGYYVIDDTFNDTEWKVKKFHDISQSLSFKISWGGYLRADLIHRFPDMAYMLKESGIVGAYHGIESLHPEASKVIGKGWSGKHAREYIPHLYHDIWNGEVAQHLNFIVGLPGETEEDIMSTVKWYMENNLHSIHFDLLYLYGKGNDKSRFSILSEFDKNAEKYGFTFSNESFDAPDQFMNWKNTTWSVKSAENMRIQASNMIRDIRKSRTWAIMPLMWYGYSYDTLLKVSMTSLPWEQIRLKTDELFLDYYRRLMSL